MRSDATACLKKPSFASSTEASRSWKLNREFSTREEFANVACFFRLGDEKKETYVRPYHVVIRLLLHIGLDFLIVLVYVFLCESHHRSSAFVAGVHIVLCSWQLRVAEQFPLALQVQLVGEVARGHMTVRAPETASCLRCLPGTDHLLLLWVDSLYDPKHHHYGVRTPLCLGFSRDRGRSWTHLGVLAHREEFNFFDMGMDFVDDDTVIITYGVAGPNRKEGPDWLNPEVMDLHAIRVTRDWLVERLKRVEGA